MGFANFVIKCVSCVGVVTAIALLTALLIDIPSADHLKVTDVVLAIIGLSPHQQIVTLRAKIAWIAAYSLLLLVANGCLYAAPHCPGNRQALSIFWLSIELLDGVYRIFSLMLNLTQANNPYHIVGSTANIVLLACFWILIFRTLSIPERHEPVPLDLWILAEDRLNNTFQSPRPYRSDSYPVL